MMPQKRARLPRNLRSEDTQIGDSSRMESPPSMEVEEPYSYLKVALNLDNIPFGITGDKAVCTEYGLKAEGVITVKIFDDGKALLTKGVSALT